ncbi:hypothetical protein ACFXG4_51020 [Nocardia sp. NPDC059246]|uniref:hypothetical protein n=1 Tax=unclassified Nocardia TaxID=2637762 RepID=UPI00367A6BEC
MTAALSCPGGLANATLAHPNKAIHYKMVTTPTSTVVETDAGSLVDDHGVFKIYAADGTVLAGAELSFRVDDFVFSIGAEIHDRTATLRRRTYV